MQGRSVRMIFSQNNFIRPKLLHSHPKLTQASTQSSVGGGKLKIWNAGLSNGINLIDKMLVWERTASIGLVHEVQFYQLSEHLVRQSGWWRLCWFWWWQTCTCWWCSQTSREHGWGISTFSTSRGGYQFLKEDTWKKNSSSPIPKSRGPPANDNS